MESVNKSFDVNEVFSGAEKAFEIFKSPMYDRDYKALAMNAIKVVNEFTDILKNVLSKPKFEKSEIANRFCEFVDMISSREDGVLWGFARQVKDGEALISFLKELATNGCISQIDKIFRSGGYRCPLVNQLSKYYETKEKFYELFEMLPEDYRDKLSGEIISYQDGDKDYAYPLIGGSALMGF